MILDYKNFIEGGTIIQVINGPYWDYVIERFDFNYYNQGKGIKIPSEYKNKMNEIEIQIENRLYRLNPIEGKYTNEKAKQTRHINFNLVPTEHWYTKFFRKEFESEIYVNPGLYEGIDIISNSINEITRQIDVGLILDKYRVLIKSRTVPQYSEIVIFRKKNPKMYDITLQTQMKGKEYKVGNEVNRILKLPPK
jgi:hypothetical protein